MLHVPPRDDPRMTRGQDGSLFLSCRTLSFPSPCRFIPAHCPSICGPIIFSLSSRPPPENPTDTLLLRQRELFKTIPGITARSILKKVWDRFVRSLEIVHTSSLEIGIVFSVISSLCSYCGRIHPDITVLEAVRLACGQQTDRYVFAIG